MKRRSAAQWERLSPKYRARLLRKGISRDDYLSGANLSRARGHGNESRHARQRAIVKKYGPYDREGIPQITPTMLRRARAKYGDDWIDERLAQLKQDYIESEAGNFPYSGDKSYSKRTRPEKVYSRLATEKLNYFAPFWWYHGVFG